MADVYLYADETGNLDYEGAAKQGASPYFGFGTVVYRDDHGAALMQGLRLRSEIAARGDVQLSRGFHAKDDSHQTRTEMYEVIAAQAPRIDTTFLLKSGAYPRVRERGQMYLYQMAWYLHLKEIALRVSTRADTLYVVAGTFGTRSRATQARVALDNVCSQVGRDIKLCVWDAATSWGLQVADYALWAIHRELVGRPCAWFEPQIRPTMMTRFTPWGAEPVTPPLPTS